MKKQYDTIMALFRHSKALTPTAATAKGALLESHTGERFHGFADRKPEQRPFASPAYSFSLNESHAAIKALRKAGNHSYGATLYMTSPPCLECSQAILAAGIQTVVHPHHNGNTLDYESCEQGNLLLGLNGVEVELWLPEQYAIN